MDDVHEDFKKAEAAKERVEAKRNTGKRETILIAGFFLAGLLFVLSLIL